MPEFRIQIERLSERPEDFEFVVEPAWWQAREPEGASSDIRIETPFVFRLRASKAGRDVVVEGDLEGEVGLECARCAKRYAHALRESYRLVLEPLGRSGREAGSARNASEGGDGRRGLDPEGERGLAENGVCLGEDLEVGLYRGPVVGLDDFFGEVIALALPIQPLCSEDCLGICPHCGAERGVDGSERRECGCEDERRESPFAVLAALKQTD